MKHKILVLGDVNGQIKSAITKISAHHKKQNFAFAVIAGNLFANDQNGIAIISDEVEELLNNKIDVPLPVYFTLGHQALPDRLVEKLQKDAGELCINLMAIGRRGRVKTTDGINIVAVSGVHSADGSARPTSWYAGGFDDKEASQAISYNEADLLITSTWPKDITAGTKRGDLPSDPMQSQSIANVCASLKPRYHFSASDIAFERGPFHHETEGYPFTNFVSLAPYNNTDKEKALFAFTLEVPRARLTSKPHDIPPAPFRMTKVKHGLTSQEVAYDDYRSNEHHPDEHRGKRRKKQGPVMPDQCFFCLSKADSEDHLIASISEQTYVAAPKGPLPKRDTLPGLGFPGHLLIVTLNHTPTIASVADDTERAKTEAEVAKYKSALKEMLRAHNMTQEVDKLGMVMWEISRAGNVHMHWQVLAVPAALIESGKVEEAFTKEAAAKHYPPLETEGAKVEAVEVGNYFAVDIWSEAVSKKMVLGLDETFRFDLQFGRAVLAKVLNLPARKDWKSCGQTYAEELADVDKFKEMFAAFDFNLPDAK